MNKLDSIMLYLTADDIIALDNNRAMLEDLIKLAKEAEAAEKLIKQKYIFSDEQEILVIYDDRYNKEYLTNDWAWHGDYINEHLYVKIDKEEIYRIYRNQYFYENNLKHTDYINYCAKAAVNFREFVKHTRIMK